jgi:uncharacterized protein (DUF488 family)
MKLFTLGHGSHPLEKFMGLLETNGVMLVADVRSAPFSRYHPQFNKESLERELPQRGVQYAWAGKFLGGRPTDPTCYKNGALPGEGTDYLHTVNYPEVMKREWFIKGIDRLLELADEHTTAILCSEENPAHCHRHHLIAKFLMREHHEVAVQHIRGDGNVFGAASILDSVEEEHAEQPPLL